MGVERKGEGKGGRDGERENKNSLWITMSAQINFVFILQIHMAKILLTISLSS